MTEQPEITDTNGIANLYGVTPRTVQPWRQEGTGPRWYRIGVRLVRYPLADAVAWMTDSEAS
jgi:phage terminase Nu1 subunit (DNA packaging protein)